MNYRGINFNTEIEITDNGNKSSLNIQFPEPIEESRFIDKFGFSAEGWHGYADQILFKFELVNKAKDDKNNTDKQYN